MALIRCPECGQMISDTIIQCIYCGYVLNNNFCTINGIIYDFSEELNMILSTDITMYNNAVSSIGKKTYLNIADAISICDIIKATRNIPSVYVPQFPLEMPSIICPYCNSNNIYKISTVSRLLSTGLFGLGSGKIGKQWHCNNCGSDF